MNHYETQSKLQQVRCSSETEDGGINIKLLKALRRSRPDKIVFSNKILFKIFKTQKLFCNGSFMPLFLCLKTLSPKDFFKFYRNRVKII